MVPGSKHMLCGYLLLLLLLRSVFKKPSGIHQYGGRGEGVHVRKHGLCANQTELNCISKS